MTRAFSEHLKNGNKVLIIGSDCAQLRSQHIRDALDALDQHDVVIGPAKDGGYYLIGMKSEQASLFENMPWSEPNLLAETLKKSQEQRIHVFLLPELSDVDTESELARIWYAVYFRLNLPDLNFQFLKDSTNPKDSS